MAQDYFIEIIVRENCKNHKIIIDKYKGSPENCIKYLSDKYVSKRNFLDKMFKALLITEEEMNILCEEK